MLIELLTNPISYLLIIILIISMILPLEVITSYNQDYSIYFSTSSTIMASLLAIIFSISLVFIQIGSQKYSFGLLQLFWNSKTTKKTLLLGIATLFVSLFILMMQWSNVFWSALVLLMILYWTYTFYKFYNFMLNITNPEKLSNLLTNEFINASKINNNSKSNQILAEFSNTIKKAIRVKEDDIVYHFCISFSKSYFYCRDNMRNDLKEVIFANYLLSYFEMIEAKHPERMYRFSFLLDVPYYEIEKNLDLNCDFLNYYYNSFLFSIYKEMIDCEDHPFFISSIDSYATSKVGFLPNLYDGLKFENTHNFITSLIGHGLDTSSYLEIYTGLNCMLDSTKYNLIYNFDSFDEISEIFNKFLNKYISDIPSNEQLLNEIESYKSLFVKECKNYYIHYRILCFFYYVGSYISFKYDQNAKKASEYYIILWDRTNSKNPYVNNLSQTPVTTNIELLTGLFIFGGNKFGYVHSDVSHKFDLFQDTEYHHIKYYLLSITWIFSKISGDKLINFEFNNDCKETIFYRLNYYKDFVYAYKDLMKCCDSLITDAENWDSLFDDPVKKFEMTKSWIDENKKICEEKLEQLEISLPIGVGESLFAKDEIVKGYQSEAVNNYFDNITASKIIEEPKNIDQFLFCSKNVKMSKSYFIDDKYTIYPITHINHIFNQIGEVISRGEIQYIINSITNNTGIISSDKVIDDPESIIITIKNVIKNKINMNYSPSILMIGSQYQKSLFGDFLGNSFEYEENINIPIYWDHSNKLDGLYIIDKNAGTLFYEKQKEDERLFLEIRNVDDDNRVEIIAYTRIFYELKDVNAISKIKLSEKLKS